MTNRSTVTKLTLVATLLACCVVVLGSFTRLSDAGLGCPDWPTCYGHFWVPKTEADVAKANELFAHAPVEHDKTWPEQLHRLFASSLGLLILVIFGFCLKAVDREHPWRSVVVCLGILIVATVTRIFAGHVLDPYLWIIVAAYFLNLSRLIIFQDESKTPFKLPAFIAGLVILQGLFGMWTVTLNLWPQVVTLHLLGGFATFSLLWLLFQRLAGWHWHADAAIVVKFMQLRPLAMLVLVLVACQIALGGWLSANYAALACPDFPLCQNSIWPEAKFAQGFNIFQHIGPNYLGGLLESKARIAIHLTHRIGAMFVLVFASILIVKLWLTEYKQARHLAVVLSAVLGLQVLLGILNVELSLPLSVAVLHNAVGALLLLTIITINHRIRTVNTL